jgi:hypothetical protein
MTRTRRNLRRAFVLLGLTGAFAIVGVTAGPGLAEGISPAQLTEHGWICFVPPAPARMACFNPAEGRPPIPPLGEEGRATYTAMAFSNPAGEFLGFVHLIRADLYAGQPCEPNGGSYSFNPRLGYYECLRIHA